MLEIWGGVECSIVRLRNLYRNQVAETGHRSRADDLERIAELGITTLRYPILWEAIAPSDPDTCDWSWHDERMHALRRLGIRPIAGLLHHGSGPRYTDLLDPGFPTLFARHAANVAARYPWIDHYTAINEPLTTARFAGLYGHWYPHRRDEADFLRMLIQQCRATLLAMRAIRTINPQAQFIQTEDVGVVFAGPGLVRQAEHENGMRWLGLDLLCGRVDRTHPWHDRLVACGMAEPELEAFAAKAACPDLIGANYYPTSDRYLDKALAAYPRSLWGGNGVQRYADAEAFRIPSLDALTGPGARLREVWTRYRLPLAVTEVHHGCTREEQLRWLAQVWTEAQALAADGVPVRAVTVWALFGSVDWNSLLRRRTGHYEPGAFDVRSTPPRPTALAGAVRQLARAGQLAHPALAAPGWWRRPGRIYPLRSRSDEKVAAPAVLILPGAGAYAAEIARICVLRGLKPVELGGRTLAACLGSGTIWAVVDAAALEAAAAMLRSPQAPLRADVSGAATAAGLCARAGVGLLAFSSDLVFDGRGDRAVVESDPVRPLGAYGASEAEREARIIQANGAALVARTGLVFGAAGLPDIAPARTGAPVSAAYLPDLLHAALDLLLDAEAGIWHLVNAGRMDWRQFAQRMARVGVAPVSAPSLMPAPLASERGRVMPPLGGALARYARDMGPRSQALRIAAE